MKTWTVIELVEWTTKFFESFGILSARLDAELLLSHVLKKDRLQLYLDFDMPVFHPHLSTFRTLIKTRSNRVPISYIISSREFMSLSFYVDERVLIPRPETEILVETVLGSQKTPCHILEIGTGSGAIAISLAVNQPTWEITATDISTAAIDVAKHNTKQHQCEEQITFVTGDLFEPVTELDTLKYDWIISNPPYIGTKDINTLTTDVKDNEPEVALFAGYSGLDIIQRLIDETPAFLKKEGKLMLEIGHNQSQQVQDLISSNPAYKSYSIIPDLSGIDRFILATARN
ncbi:protein-(glutamine-N5) methyltransferase, release factor-specific [Candidatus Poribacteria bacterium]|nr:protein-(glutamine-N5) methyltransferase, release factor-specific [Candidatus Poribacteria bacterium]